MSPNSTALHVGQHQNYSRSANYNSVLRVRTQRSNDVVVRRVVLNAIVITHKQLNQTVPVANMASYILMRLVMLKLVKMNAFY